MTENGSGKAHAGRFPAALSRRDVIIGGALLGTAAVANALVPTEEMDLLGSAELENVIPKQIGGWEFFSKSGLVVPPEDELSDALYAQVLTRVYLADGRLPIMLLIAQSPAQDGVLQLHRPEVCYPFGGYTLSGSRLHEVELRGRSSIPTRVFTASGPSRIEQLLYWTRIGSELPLTWLQQRLAVAGANFRGQIPDGVLVRISAIAPDQSAVRDLDAFAKALIGSVSGPTRNALIGS